ncbi:hypothetical protein [Oryzifoliimicrobium ureilyticus]
MIKTTVAASVFAVYVCAMFAIAAVPQPMQQTAQLERVAVVPAQ